MTDDQSSRRKPLGERDEHEKQQPFGSRPRPAGYEQRPAPPARPPTPFAPPTAPPERPTPPPPPDLDSLLDTDDDPSRLSWDALIADVDAAPADAPSRKAASSRPRILEKGARQAESRRESFLKRRPVQQDIQALSYLEEAEEEDETARAQVVIRFGVVLRSLGVMVAVAVVVATLFTWWTPSNFLPSESVSQLAVALATQAGQQPTAVAAPADPSTTIGVVSGHRGLYPATGLPDPGAVCPDGLTEQQVNENVAMKVVALLQAEGYRVDLLDEWDSRLQGYRALAMVSIHADSCEYINDQATGFKVASFAYSTAPEADARLVACLSDRYAAATGLPQHPSVTFDMTEYHNFQEIASGTPGAIIEIGFLYLDRAVLTERADDVARGIADGVLCFVRNELPAGATNAPPTGEPVTPTP